MVLQVDLITLLITYTIFVTIFKLLSNKQICANIELVTQIAKSNLREQLCQPLCDGVELVGCVLLPQTNSVL